MRYVLDVTPRLVVTFDFDLRVLPSSFGYAPHYVYRTFASLDRLRLVVCWLRSRTVILLVDFIITFAAFDSLYGLHFIAVACVVVAVMRVTVDFVRCVAVTFTLVYVAFTVTTRVYYRLRFTLRCYVGYTVTVAVTFTFLD